MIKSSIGMIQILDMKNRMNITKKKIVPILWGVTLSIGSAYTFYNAWYGFIFGIPIGVYGYICSSKRQELRLKREMLDEFKNLIVTMQGALEAGRAMENAFVLAGRELEQMYGANCEIAKSVRVVEKKLGLNVSFEKALTGFANELDIEEVYDFIDVISTIKRTGGNAIKVIKDTTQKLIEEIELREELAVMVAAKKLEQQVLIYMPSLIILFLRISNKGFLDPLYGNVVGVAIMTVVLLVNILSDYLGKRIVDIY